jgi:hypothetical protein
MILFVLHRLPRVRAGRSTDQLPPRPRLDYTLRAFTSAREKERGNLNLAPDRFVNADREGAQRFVLPLVFSTTRAGGRAGAYTGTRTQKLVDYFFPRPGYGQPN